MADQNRSYQKLMKLEETLQKMLRSLQDELNKVDIEWTQLCVVAEQHACGNDENMEVNESQPQSIDIDDPVAINEQPLDVNSEIVDLTRIDNHDEEFDSSGTEG